MAGLIDLIDDDDAVRDSTHALLDALGYGVREFASAEAFLAEATSKADCLVIDQHMPGMTGLELLERLRAGGDYTPAIMVTGRSDPDLEPRVAALGSKVLHKPVDENELVRWLDEIRHKCPK